LPAVSCIAWLGEVRGFTLWDVTRISGRNVEPRPVVVSLKLVSAVVACREVETAAVLDEASRVQGVLVTVGARVAAPKRGARKQSKRQNDGDGEQQTADQGGGGKWNEHHLKGVAGPPESLSIQVVARRHLTRIS
jgi:hypothetical protein